MRVYSHDAFCFLDGAWRLLQGQIPHADFYTGLGPFMYLWTAAGLWFSHGGAEGFGYAQAAFGLWIGLWAFLLSKDRLSGTSTWLMCIFLVLLSVAPFSMGEKPWALSPATVYNRYGDALASLVLLEAVGGSRFSSTQSSELWGGFSTGAVLAIVFFMKMSYFIGILVLLAALIPFRQQRQLRWFGMVAAFGACFLLFAYSLQFHLGAFFADLRMVSGGKHINPFRLIWLAFENLTQGGLTLTAFLLISAMLIWNDWTEQFARAFLWAGAIVFGAGLVFIATNNQEYGLPINAALAILVIDYLTHKPLKTSHANAALRSAVVLFGLVLVGVSMLPDMFGLAWGVKERIAARQGNHPLFHTKPLANFGSEDETYVHFVNDGLDLVQANAKPGDTVMSLDFTNFFSYALQTPPAPGGSTWLQYGTNFDDTHKPAPERLFGSATLVAVPKTFSDASLQESVPRLYGPFLQQHFAEIAESREWRLYRNRNSERAATY